ncbi:hypothetical protein [Limosilactobacillus allomucosae]|uniref:hypothetical protein n=1 Tax=Limosilactobacillus allomucosae TaxID=3142938 RepID=UPI003267A6A9
MARLILHNKKILSVKETTSDIERQKKIANKVFCLHLSDNTEVTLARKDILVMEDNNTINSHASISPFIKYLQQEDFFND